MRGVIHPAGRAPWLSRIAASLGFAASALAALALAGCDNSPWELGAQSSNTLYSAAQENSPRHLDPTASYWSNDTPFTYQIYEPPYAYHYLKRPFELMGRSAERVAKPVLLDKDGKVLPADASGELVAESVYDIPVKHGILYQPHPAFRQGRAGPVLLPRNEAGRARQAATRRASSSTRARASSWPRTSSMRSSATPRRASRRPSTACSPNT